MRLPVAVLIAIAAVAVCLPSASRADTQCGRLTEDLFVYNGTTYQTYSQVEVAQGSVSCAKARAVVRAYDGLATPPRGWHCARTESSGGESDTDRCRHSTVLVYGFQTFVPRPASTPGNFFDCPDIDSSNGIYYATAISTTHDTCTNARVVAREFMDDPACAINFHSSSNYDCFETIGERTYHCTGTIETARESSIACAYDGKGDGFSFNMDD
jgi:hypothetical protein